MALTDLPYTIFADIVAYLSPREAVAARRISRTVRAALTRDELCISLLLLHFPRSREARELRSFLQQFHHTDTGAEGPLAQICWADALAATARRYHNLSTASPRQIRTVPVLHHDDDGDDGSDDDGDGDDRGRRSPRLLRGVTPWNRFLRLDEKTAAFHYWDPTWTCDADAGVLVYPAAGQRAYRLQDISSGRTWAVPFATDGRVVRRVRLSHGILIFEWCEQQGLRALRDEELAHRHFATAYDVKRAVSNDRGQNLYTLRTYKRDRHEMENEAAAAVQEWEVTFRAEWKIQYLGLLLSHQDRFFSTHNSTHYVVYIWQPPRSPWGEDAPLERLIIWSLGEPDPYRPSLRTLVVHTTTSSSLPNSGSNHSNGRGPRIITKLTNTQLDHWGVRQRDTPSLRGLRLDDVTQDPVTGAAAGHVFFVEEEHRWSAGPHSKPHPPRLHHVKATGVPLAAGSLTGPRWVDECGPPGQDPAQMQFCWRGREARSRNTHHAAVPDAPSAPAMETWPGRCPCWRHDDFPYLTVCEVNDVAAGVRFSARHCFMLETLSVHIKPRLRIHGVARPDEPARRRSRSSRTTSSSSSSSSSGTRDVARTNGGSEGKARRATPPHGQRPRVDDGERPSEDDHTSSGEIQFADDAWGRLLGAGYICGDERWLIGQDAEGDITIMHF